MNSTKIALFFKNKITDWLIKICSIYTIILLPFHFQNFCDFWNFETCIKACIKFRNYRYFRKFLICVEFFKSSSFVCSTRFYNRLWSIRAFKIHRKTINFALLKTSVFSVSILRVLKCIDSKRGENKITVYYQNNLYRHQQICSVIKKSLKKGSSYRKLKFLRNFFNLKRDKKQTQLPSDNT